MNEALQGPLARRWRVVAAAVLVAVGLVTVWSYLTPKHWQASVVVQLDPVVVPGLRVDTPTPSTPEEAVRAELAIARGDDFQQGLADNTDFPFTLTVEPGPTPATLRFTADAGSAERAVAASYGGANGFIAWGRAQQVVSRQALLQRELDALAPGDPTTGVLQARLEVATAALAQLDGGGGTVVVKPTVPDDPVAPNLAARLLVAAFVGLVVGLALAWWLGRRATGDAPTVVESRPAPPPRAARLALAAVAVTAFALPVAAVGAAVIGVWELRPSTNAQDQAGYACLPRWLADLPDGTAVGVSGDSPRFFADHLQEFAFPRLVIPPPGAPPAVVLTIVPGPGPDPCGGYHRELTRP